jgi:hypothetical protein
MSGEDPRLRFVWEEALRAIERQEDNLTALHARAAAILSAASIAAGFLGNSALGEGQKFRGATWVGAIAFAVVGVLTAAMLLPRKGWKFRREPKDLLEHYVDHEQPAEIDEMHRVLAGHLGDDFDNNERKLRWRYWMLTGSCVALAVEILAFLWDLRDRR